MFTKKDRKIANQKVMIDNRNKLIKKQRDEIDLLNAVNKDLRFENEELIDFKRKVLNIMTGKGTIVDKYDKINELVDLPKSN